MLPKNKCFYGPKAEETQRDWIEERVLANDFWNDGGILKAGNAEQIGTNLYRDVQKT